METRPDPAGPHPTSSLRVDARSAVRLATRGPADLAGGVRSSELVDVVDDAAVAAVAAAVTDATDRLADRPQDHREGRATRSPVDVEIVIPAYNESGRLPATLTAMSAFLSGQPFSSRIVVVDNGSADDTAASVLTLADGSCATGEAGCVEVVAVGCSRAGKGAAVHRGLRTSRSRVVGFTDADLSTPLETLLPALAALQDGAAAAIASRHAPGARFAVRQPLRRRLGGDAFRLLSRPLLPGIHDSQCGFKFFARETVQSALWRCRSTGFAFDVELLRLIRDDGGRIVEIPVTWTDTAGSTLRPVRDGLAAFTAVARLHRELTRSPRGPALPAAASTTDTTNTPDTTAAPTPTGSPR